ncbi:ORF6C domain-containing protein [Brevibacillus laterosporus]|uniref:ORF6C domain-containing protein n=1 Tax=Brevibacillus laterosporus TaxID=1465 RepID=UPI003D21BDC1
MKLAPIEYQGERVLTTMQLSESYRADRQQISYNFNNNIKRYKEGKHYIKLEGEEKRNFLDRHEIHDGSKNASVIYLWTKKGAWMHAKSLNTDEAWDAYEMLVDEYYRVTEQHLLAGISPEIQAILSLDMRTQGFEKRLVKLESSKTIDYGQQLELQNIARRQVVLVLGGKDGLAYQNNSLRGKVFSAVWKDYKDYFNIESYKNTLLCDFDKAKEYIGKWNPHGKLLREIEEANQQMSFT